MLNNKQQKNQDSLKELPKFRYRQLKFGHNEYWMLTPSQQYMAYRVKQYVKQTYTRKIPICKLYKQVYNKELVGQKYYQFLVLLLLMRLDGQIRIRQANGIKWIHFRKNFI